MKYNFISVLVLLAGCNLFYSKEEKKILEQALQIHLQAAQLAASLKQEVETLLIDSSLPSDSLRILLDEIVQWENSLVEVPGMDHHDHHSSSEPIQVSAEEMLRMQQEALVSIQMIQGKLKKLQQNL
jgi:hypothetical protein